MSEREESNLMLLYGLSGFCVVMIALTYVLTWILG
jgi:hypothetical protein